MKFVFIVAIKDSDVHKMCFSGFFFIKKGCLIFQTALKLYSSINDETDYSLRNMYRVTTSTKSRYIIQCTFLYCPVTTLSRV